MAPDTIAPELSKLTFINLPNLLELLLRRVLEFPVIQMDVLGKKTACECILHL